MWSRDLPSAARPLWQEKQRVAVSAVWTKRAPSQLRSVWHRSHSARVTMWLSGLAEARTGPAFWWHPTAVGVGAWAAAWHISLLMGESNEML